VSDDEPLQHPRGRGLRPGVAMNPGGLTRTERQVRRRIGEVGRELHTAEEFLSAMWSILEGVDPFADKRKRQARPADGLPVLGAAEEPIRWEHRVAAGKIYAEYSWGKPVQGVVVDAAIDQRVQLEGGAQAGPIDFRSMPPEVRLALRAAAAAALGRPAPALLLPAGSVRVVDERDTQAGQVAGGPLGVGRGPLEPDERAPRQDLGDAALDQRPTGPADQLPVVGGVAESGVLEDLDDVVTLDDLLALDEDGRRVGDPRAVGERGAADPDVAAVVGVVGGPARGARDGGVVGHGQTVAEPAAAVKPIRLDFRQSANLVDAELAGGDPRTSVLTVRFRAPGGQGVARTYRYRHVTPAMMQAWERAPSAGAWFSREIRARHQQYPVIRDEPLSRAESAGMVTL
jgi:hypothetical protein